MRILIIGAGFSGLGLAIRLRQRGITDFVLLERADDLGGTWRDNSYPGCACDVQSTLYSYSFAPNPEWSRTFSPQAEIWAYLRRCADQFDIRRHIVFGANVTGATWSDATQMWTVTTDTREWQASVLVAANGPLSDPAIPVMPNRDAYRGVAFHSAQWRHDVDLRDARVAVIGSGASAIQFVPHVQRLARSLTLFQRTPPWILPRHDRAVSAWRRSLYRTLPIVQRAQRAMLYALRELMFVPFRHQAAARVAQGIARKHLAAQVPDATLRATLSPTYTIGCKRILLSDDYYPAVTQPNVSVLTTRIDRWCADGLVTADGTVHAADVVIFATGFHVTDSPIAERVYGRDGRSLADTWGGSPLAYLGTMTAGFPNLFFLLGPNTGLGHSSVVLMIEAQIEHLLGVLAAIDARHAGAVEPTAEAQRAFAQWVDARMQTTVWNRGGCRSWYLDVNGRNSALWPERVGRFRRAVRSVRERDHHFVERVVS